MAGCSSGWHSSSGSGCSSTALHVGGRRSSLAGTRVISGSAGSIATGDLTGCSVSQSISLISVLAVAISAVAV